MDRRQYLVTAATAGVTVLAGCQGDEDDDTAETQAPAETGETPDVDADADDSEGTEPSDESVELGFTHPDTVDFDEPFDLRIAGLPAETTVDVVLESDFAADGTTAATATIETEDGDVSLDDASAVDGAVPSGLGVPLQVALAQFLRGWEWGDGDTETLTYRVEREAETLGSTSLTRTFPSEDWVQQVETEDLIGQLATPPDGATGPPVLVLHGAGGRPLTGHALAFAAHGHVAFALQYFGDHEMLPDDLVEIPLNYVERAIEWLLDHDSVDDNRVNLFGRSKGGELALLTGSEFSQVGAVVSHVGSGVAWQGLNADWSLADGPSWVIDGEPVPYVPYASDADWEVESPQGYIDSLEAASDEEISDATIQVENIEGDVLLVSGADDNLWNTVDLHTIAEQRLSDHDHSAFDHLVYDGAGHNITIPYLSVDGTVTRQMGGTKPSYAFAAHDHWPHVLGTLATSR